MDWNTVPEDHPTPSLVIDANVVRRNIQSMQSHCNAHHLKLRPHTKTHKSIWMGRQQMDAGAIGLTMAKVGEAEVMSQVSDDLFLAYPAVGSQRLQRLAALARNKRVTVGIDSPLAADFVRDAACTAGVEIGVLLDVDVGFHRTGVVEPQQAMELGTYIANQKHLRLDGLMCFPGHLLPSSSDAVWDAYEESLRVVVDGLNSKGIQTKILSGGSTPTALHSHRNRMLTEIRPGTYIYNDLNEVRLGVCRLEDCAARLLATIVSVPARNKFVMDAGSKALSSDRNAANPDSGFGFVYEYPTAKIARLSEEHGEVHIPDEDLDKFPPPRVGERVWVLPNHICVCVNLQNEFSLIDGGELHTMRVDARGLLV